MGEPKLLHPIGAKTTWLMEAVQNASLIGWVVVGGGERSCKSVSCRGFEAKKTGHTKWKWKGAN